jgi:general secretion pathway protein D
MRRFSGLIGLIVLWTTAISLLPGLASGQQRGTASPADKRFSEGTELVQLDFKDVELAVVIETIARITGQNFIYDDRVRGRVTIVSPSEVTVDQAFAVFESVLKIKGFTAVPGPGGILKIVPVRDAKESSLETIKDGRPSPNRDTFVTRLVPLLYIDAEAITNTIKPLVSKDASMVAYAPTNTIILTDTEANIRRLLSILEAIDIKTYKEELAVIKIQFADANTLGEQISEIYGASVSSVSAAGGSANRARRASNRRGSNTTALPGSSASPDAKVRIMTDERTNSLLILASRTSVSDIRELVRKLDVPLVGGGRIHVYYLNHADSEELASTLSSMLSGQSSSTQSPGRTGAAGGQVQNLRSQVTALAEGITLSPDPATNSLVIQASKEAYEALVAVIEKLDIPRPQVLVEALIIEVDVTDGIELGVSWTINAINGDQQFYFTTARAAAGGGAGDLGGVIARAFPTGADGITRLDTSTATGTNYDAVISAAAKDTNLNVVSSPHILTSDNEEAEIRIGNNIPIITSRVNSATGNSAGLASSVNVERQDIGVTLRVTPQISEGDTLRLKIFQELTDINESLQSGVGSADEVGVALFNRKIENTVVVKDGETVVVGGLISDRWRDDSFKVPFLGDIPGLGWAFKTNTKELRKINLLVFLTPHIIRSAEEMELETIRKRMDFETDLGETYNTDPDPGQELTKTDGRIDKGINPAYDALRKHSDRYSPLRRAELEAKIREQERLSEQLATSGGNRSAYGLRVQIYDDEDAAASALLELLDAGYESSLTSNSAGERLVYELQTGPYDELKTAQAEAEVLAEVYEFTPVVTVLDGPAESTDEPEEAPPSLNWPASNDAPAEEIND